MFFSNAKYYIKSTISSTATVGGTFTLSTDIELGSNLETAGNSVSMVLKNGTQIERFEITATGGTGTIVKRGLTQSSTSTADVLLQKQWQDGTLAYVTALAFDIVDKQGDTMTGALKFSGTTHEGIVPISLTTAQRIALTPTGPAIVYDNTLSELYQYIGGSWSAVSAGSTQPNASTTVAGKVEIATTAQSVAGTNTGETGALLSVLPSDIAANEQSGTFVYTASTDITDTYTANLTPAITSYATGMRVMVKFTTANTGACSINLNSLGAKNIKLIDGTDPLDGDITANGIYEFIYDGTNMVLQSTAVRSSDSDATTGTNTLKFITPKQAKDNYTLKTVAGSFTYASGASTVIAHGLGKAPKFIEFSYARDSTAGSSALCNGSYDGTTNRSLYQNGSGTYGLSTAFAMAFYTASSAANTTAVVTWDDTNITITYTANSGGLSGSSFNVTWYAIS